MSGALNFLGDAQVLFVLLAHVAKDVFHHHYCSVHHHAEIESAQREKIGWNVTQIEQNRCKQEGEGNGECDNQCAPQVAKEQEQDHRYQHDALGQVVQNRMGGQVNQIAPVQVGYDLHTDRQDMFVQLIHFFM